ncbi:hypothetical protein LUZ63_015087 [Rhynchospora breviuscula]|uniref:Beta-amylase n=1 Tax=Rhynchospora breviuscula TaxID=2022672 RepID=A0A9Q0CBN7_9POAL|nr:hypothetical protein LUZ63_015087 [Rhynchospora breviuscula]
MALKPIKSLSFTHPRRLGQFTTNSISPSSTARLAAQPLCFISPPGSFRQVNHQTEILNVTSHGVFSHSVDVMRASASCFATRAFSGSIPSLLHDDVISCYVPVYVMLPLGTINLKCEVSDQEGLINDLRLLKSTGVDGVMVDCWWGIVEDQQPRQYNWSGYKRLFQIIKELDLKLQVIMSFHRCSGNLGDDTMIPLPSWVTKVGNSNPDIYFTDKDGRRSTECLTCGIDQEPVLQGRTAIEVYADFMRSFRTELDQFFKDGTISKILVGLGPCGELRYPSFPKEYGWRYPGIGEFQCYDHYLMISLRKAAEEIGYPCWGHGPEDAGSYNSRPSDIKFFRDQGKCSESRSFYSRFFLGWYSKILIDHADMVIMQANLMFKGTPIAAKVACVHWWYDTTTRAAEQTAGFDNSWVGDGYEPIVTTLKKYDAQLHFTCVEECKSMQEEVDFPEAVSNREELIWQVQATAWRVGVPVACEKAVPFFGRNEYKKILKDMKSIENRNLKGGVHLVGFTYLRLCPALFEETKFSQFKHFVKKMHGEEILDDCT